MPMHFDFFIKLSKLKIFSHFFPGFLPIVGTASLNIPVIPCNSRL